MIKLNKHSEMIRNNENHYMLIKLNKKLKRRLFSKCFTKKNDKSDCEEEFQIKKIYVMIKNAHNILAPYSCLQ